MLFIVSFRLLFYLFLLLLIFFILILHLFFRILFIFELILLVLYLLFSTFLNIFTIQFFIQIHTLRQRKVQYYCSSFEICPIKFIYGIMTLIFSCKLHKCKSFAYIFIRMHGNINLLDLSIRRQQLFQVFLIYIHDQITNYNSIMFSCLNFSSFLPAHLFFTLFVFCILNSLQVLYFFLLFLYNRLHMLIQLAILLCVSLFLNFWLLFFQWFFLIRLQLGFTKLWLLLLWLCSRKELILFSSPFANLIRGRSVVAFRIFTHQQLLQLQNQIVKIEFLCHKQFQLQIILLFKLNYNQSSTFVQSINKEMKQDINEIALEQIPQSTTFESQPKLFRVLPIQQRKCKDSCCVFTFLIFLIIGLGLFVFILVLNQTFDFTQFSENIVIQVAAKNLPSMAGLTIFAMLLAMFHNFLIKRHPVSVSYITIFLNYILYLFIVVCSVMYRQYPLVFVPIIGLIIFSIVLCCYQKDLKLGFKLISVVDYAIQGTNYKSYIVIASFLLLNLAFVAFYMIGLFGSYSYKSKTYVVLAYDSIMQFWYLFGVVAEIYLCYCLFYSLTSFFLIEINKNNKQSQPSKQPCINLRSLFLSLSSITFSTFSVCLLALIKRLLPNKICISNQQNVNEQNGGCKRLYKRIWTCITREKQRQLYMLNHNSVIGSAIFGEGCLQSATKMALLTQCSRQKHYSQYLKSIQLFTDFIGFQSLSFVTVFPSIIAGLICFFSYEITSQQSLYEVYHKAVICGTLVFVMCFFLCFMILSVTFETVSILFAFYCLKQKKMGPSRKMEGVQNIFSKELFCLLREVFEENGQQKQIHQVEAQENSQNIIIESRKNPEKQKHQKSDIFDGIETIVIDVKKK